MASLAFRLIDGDRHVGLAGELAQLTDKFVLIRQRTPLFVCLFYIVLFRTNVQTRRLDAARLRRSLGRPAIRRRSTRPRRGEHGGERKRAGGRGRFSLILGFFPDLRENTGISPIQADCRGLCGRQNDRAVSSLPTTAIACFRFNDSGHAIHLHVDLTGQCAVLSVLRRGVRQDGCGYHCSFVGDFSLTSPDEPQ